MSQPPPAPVESPASGAGLRRDCLSFPEVLGQSVANVAPTATPTMNIPLVFAAAGEGTWFAYLLATLGVLVVGWNLNQFARRRAEPGSLYTYVSEGLGTPCGLLAGWALAGGYLLLAAATMSGFADYGEVLLRLAGFRTAPVALFTLAAGTAWYCAYRDIRLSAATMLVLELLSVVVILALTAICLIRLDNPVDPVQLSLRGMSHKGLALGMVAAMLSFAGFESAASLGGEARDPLRAIPRSVVGSTLFSGVFFVAVAYVEVLGFRGLDPPLDKSDAPLNALALQAGVGFYGILISAAAALSFFACCLASINAGSRIAYSLAGHQMLHPLMARIHPVNRTPAVAVTMYALAALGIASALSLLGVGVLETYGYLGTLGTYPFLLVYALLAVAAPVYLRRRGALRAIDGVLAALGALFMIGIIAANVYPPPAPPFRAFPYLFLISLALGGGWLLMLRLYPSKPATLPASPPNE